MTRPPVNRDKIVVNIGELVFGAGHKPLCTLLGSCVAITLWHPSQRLSGMCHFALPSSPDSSSARALNARYADDCIELFRRLSRNHNTQLCEFRAKVFGGGDMLDNQWSKKFIAEQANAENIGEFNAAQAFSLLSAENVKILEADVGERGYRKIKFDPVTGNAQSRFFSVD